MLLLAGYGLACILGYFRFIPEIPLLKDYRCVFLSIYIACPIIFGLFLWWIIWGSKKLPERIVVLVGKVKPFNTLPPDPDSLKGGVRITIRASDRRKNQGARGISSCGESS
jgi:hypothetical protein